MKITERSGKLTSHISNHPIIVAVVILAVGFLLGLWARSDDNSTGDVIAEQSVVHAAHGKNDATLWTCSMHPQIRSDKPGKCPICGMDLIPVAQTSGGMRTLAISPEARALMRVETAPVERRYVTHSIPMVGKVDYDETRLGYITAWVAGRLDRLYVDYTGVAVRKGDHLVYVYSEPLYAAQEELIQAVRYAQQRPADTNRIGSSSINLVESAREKLRLLGLNEEQIKQIESSASPSDHITIYSPASGVVIDKLKQEGERVSVGERIYTVADLGQVWVHLDAYESDLPWIRYGQDVTITTEAYPGEEFHGRIAFIQPVLNDKTRTVKVRVNVPNPDGKLKPEMFVHAVGRPTVAAGGRVMDPSLSGKWICPMHPEIVKDDPGTCDICGMALVQAESLGFVSPESDRSGPPLTIPYLAALVTGTRAIVYVELPTIHSAAEPAFRTLSAVVGDEDLDNSRDAFATYARMMDQPYDQPGTDYARRLWSEIANRLATEALAGERATSIQETQDVLTRIESTMNEARERFSPAGQPTFEGREIVLGPRAGDYYLVRNGLEEGEIVVTHGNFKIDAEIQIQAKPSMMTPEGGGGGGHQHGGGSPKKTSGNEHAGHQQAVPTEFAGHLQRLEAAYEQVSDAIRQLNLDEATAAFTQFGENLKTVDASSLTGHQRMLWREFAMLLDNDAVEGSDVRQLSDADRVFLALKGHMRRLREQFGVAPEKQQFTQHFAVDGKFQFDLARIWEQYRAVGEALATDNVDEAHRYVPALRSAVETVNANSLNADAASVWNKERASLYAAIDELESATTIDSMRSGFAAVSLPVGALARSFEFGQPGSIYELHCPMAFHGKGAMWYQATDEVRNPYFGSSMLACADRVERIVPHEQSSHRAHTAPMNADAHQGHSAN